MDLQEVEKAVLEIQERNKKVEADKAWETSLTRKAVIACLTYAAVLILFLTLGISEPFINALVPTAGFLLSTLSLPWFKKWWIASRKQKERV